MVTGERPDGFGRRSFLYREAMATGANATAKPPIDDIDRRIIELLQHDGRASFQNISEAIELSRPSTRARVLRLLDDRIVEVRGVVHPSVFGLHAYAHASVVVTGPAARVGEVLAADEDVPFVSVTAGAHALVVELRCADQQSLAAALARITAIDGVAQVTTSSYLSIAKDAYWPPRPLSVSDVDTTDRLLLEMLQRDGRTSFVELGKHTELSPSAVRTRVARLIDGGVLHIGARIRPDVLNTQHVVGFGLTVHGDSSPVIEQLQEWDTIQYLASCIGRYAVIGTAISVSHSQMAEVIDLIRASPGVHVVDTWTHLRFVKEDYDHSPVG